MKKKTWALVGFCAVVGLMMLSNLHSVGIYSPLSDATNAVLKPMRLIQYWNMFSVNQNFVISTRIAIVDASGKIRYDYSNMGLRHQWWPDSERKLDWALSTHRRVDPYRQEYLRYLCSHTPGASRIEFQTARVKPFRPGDSPESLPSRADPEYRTLTTRECGDE